MRQRIRPRTLLLLGARPAPGRCVRGQRARGRPPLPGPTSPPAHMLAHYPTQPMAPRAISGQHVHTRTHAHAFRRAMTGGSDLSESNDRRE
eukprot:1024110-Rhodomonas_salina.1